MRSRFTLVTSFTFPGFSFLGLLLPGLLLPLFLVGCPEPECRAANSCGEGRRCIDEVCVDLNLPNPDVPEPGVSPSPEPEDGGVTSGDGGVTSGNSIAVITEVNWMQRDPNDTNQALYSQTDGTIDFVGSLNLTTGEVSMPTAYQFLQNANGRCAAEPVIFKAPTTPGEIWLACNESGQPMLRALYVGSEIEAAFEPGLQLNEGVFIDDVASATFAPRALTFERGGANLVSTEMVLNLGRFAIRRTDVVVPDFEEIVQIYSLPTPSGFAGETVLVHDALNDELLPLLHISGSTEWIESTYLNTFALPENTHIAYPFGLIQAGGRVATDPNVLVLSPVDGTARFWNYETGSEVAAAIFFESDSNHLVSELPNSSDRRLFSVSPSGNYAMYALYGGERIWRISLTSPFTANILRYQSEAGPLTGIVAENDDEVWVSYQGQIFLRNVGFR
ncbi:MAG: hypothetical protein GY822_20475 [Deltaproteobacteria bacterium]|nr:hypothetical protein [Deltaproteobacteria bacterium]